MKVRRTNLCAHAGCKRSLSADNTSGVCHVHIHQEACNCVQCGGDGQVRYYKTPSLLPPPWEKQIEPNADRA